MYEVEKHSYIPDNIIAGEFPVVTEVGNVGTDVIIEKYTPIIEVGGVIENVTAESIDNIIGISAENSNGETVLYYATGEFYADAIVLPDGITIEDVRAALRKNNIYLR